MGVRDWLAGALERAAGSLRYPMAAPDVRLPGVSRVPSSTGGVDPRLAQALGGVDALFGRVTYDAGPSMSRFSSFPATDLTPQKIIGAQQEAISGYPLRWSEMIEQVLSRDSHLAGIGQQRVDDVIKGSWKLVRAKNDDVALAIRNFCEEQLRDVPELDDALAWLLWSNAYCYAADEVTWRLTRVTFPGPKGEVLGPIDVIVPARLDQVHAKHFRFDMRTDEPMLWIGSGYAQLPLGKFIFVKGEGQHPITERRGYGWQTVWHSMFRSIGWAGWSVFVDRFAMPIPMIEYNGGVAQYAEYKQAYDDILNSLGSGKGAVYPSDGARFRIEQPASGGRSSDPHSAFADACDAAQSVRVLGATLTAKIGNVGSFAASTSHMEVKYAREEADARRMWGSLRSQLLAPMVLFNAEALATALRAAGYNADPDMVRRRVPRGLHRVPREVDPYQRMQMIDLAVNKLGMRISAEAMYDEMNFAQPLDDADVLSGAAQQVNKGGALVGAVEASNEGAEAPPDPQESSAAGSSPDAKKERPETAPSAPRGAEE